MARVFLLERYTTHRIRKRSKGGHEYKTKLIKTAVAVLDITGPTSAQAPPKRLATYVGGHGHREQDPLGADITFRQHASHVRQRLTIPP